ncbi:MAG TPA: hypothetical protein VK508_14550 [Cyclobacteriaceae bacterium]|nr:hypothetical protein [Cyclobacteriaceae bacterium]
MKSIPGILITLLIWCSCQRAATPDTRDLDLAVASQFIDAFYSFNKDSLDVILVHAPDSKPEILYYQQWAKCGHYEIVKRSDLVRKNDSTLVCPVTVKDDLMAALKVDFNVTDSFRVTIIKGQIRSVRTSSNDPAEYYQAKEWIKQNRPELIEKPCEGIWEGGPTPCECIEGMVKGMKEFQAEYNTNR